MSDSKRSRKRTLRFVVTSALLSAPLVLGGCKKDERKGPVEEPIVNTGPAKTQDPPKRVNVTKTLDAKTVGKTNPWGPAGPPAKTNPGPQPRK